MVVLVRGGLGEVWAVVLVRGGLGEVWAFLTMRGVLGEVWAVVMVRGGLSCLQCSGQLCMVTCLYLLDCFMFLLWSIKTCF